MSRLDMHLTLYRFSESPESTIGLLYEGKYFNCFTLEDQYQKVKVEGETRIPEGLYKVKQRRVLSGLTKKYPLSIRGLIGILNYKTCQTLNMFISISETMMTTQMAA